MQEYIKITDTQKQQLLKESDSFCMLPWVSVHQTPEGTIGPCCISNFESEPVDIHTVEGIANSDDLKEIRMDMLNGVRNSRCRICYDQEDAHPNTISNRTDSNREFAEYFDAVHKTQPDGTLDDFKLRYLDIRFSNLCNMKCRSCGTGYSSQWETEFKQHPDDRIDIIEQVAMSLTDPEASLASIMPHVPHLHRAYFAGGEPLITREHYVILKELLANGRDDLQIIYNTNISNLKYGGEELVDLWQQFPERVRIFASIDAHGDAAGFIRHGVDWETIERNYKSLQKVDNIDLNITTTVTALNYCLLPDFIMYMYDNDMLPHLWQLNMAFSPDYLASTVLPINVRKKAFIKTMEVIERISPKLENPNYFDSWRNILYSNMQYDQWQELNDEFKYRMNRLDNIRGESITTVIPQLAELFK